MQTPATSSGLRSADATIVSGPCRLLGVELIGDGTNACSVIVYNSLSASGTAVAKLSLPASGICYVDANCPVAGIDCQTGLTADITGTGAAYILHYSLS